MLIDQMFDQGERERGVVVEAVRLKRSTSSSISSSTSGGEEGVGVVVPGLSQSPVWQQRLKSGSWVSGVAPKDSPGVRLAALSISQLEKVFEKYSFKLYE